MPTAPPEVGHADRCGSAQGHRTVSVILTPGEKGCLMVTDGQPALQVRARDRPDSTDSQADTLALFASGGASGSRMDRKVQRPAVRVWLRWVHPLAIGQDRPSRLGPPEGGRRREDEPSGRVTRLRSCEADEHQNAEDRVRPVSDEDGPPARNSYAWALTVLSQTGELRLDSAVLGG